jgi:hypothetical protein
VDRFKKQVDFRLAGEVRTDAKRPAKKREPERKQKWNPPSR